MVSGHVQTLSDHSGTIRLIRLPVQDVHVVQTMQLKYKCVCMVINVLINIISLKGIQRL